MKRNSCLLTIAIILLSFSYAKTQDLSFATNLNIQNPSGYKENKVLISGNDIFIVGNFSGTTLFGGGGTGTSVTPLNNDIYILRYSSTGSFVSQMFVSGSNNQIFTSAVLDPGGWLYICGKYASGGLLGSTALAPPVGSYDMFVAKVNPYSSQTIWVTNLGSTLDDEASDIGIAVENGSYFVYITGHYSGTTLNIKDSPASTAIAKQTNTQSGNYDGVLVKFNASNGNYLNSRNMGGSGNDYTRALAINSVSYPTSYTMVQVFGEYSSTNFKADIGTTLTNNGASDIFQAAFWSYYTTSNNSGSPSTSLNYYFSKGFGSTNYDYVNDAVSLTNGNTVVTGSFHGSMNISDGSLTVTLTPNELFYGDVFVACFAPYVNLNWAKSFGGNYYDKPSGIAADNSNNFYVVGNTQSISIDLDPSPAKSTTYTNSGYSLSDYFLSKFNASGEFMWGQKGGSTGDDRLYSVFINSSDQQFVTGAFSGTNDFNLGAATNNLTSIGSDDHFLAKYSCSGGITVTSQPQSQTVCYSNSSSLSFGVSGLDIKYQWYKDGQPISGATSSTYSISNTYSSHEGNYMCIASKLCQSDIQSNTVSITLKYPVYANSSDYIYTYEICQGGSKTLRVTAYNGTLPYTYQWYKNDVLISGNTTDSLKITNIDPSQAGTYRCRVSNSCNNTDVTLTVVYNSNLSIAQQPQSVTKTIGQNATIKTIINGSGTHYTSWYQDGQWINSGDSIVFNPLMAVSMGKYYSITSNACNTVTSNEIIVDAIDPEIYPAGWKFQANSGGSVIYDIFMYNKFIGYAVKYKNSSQPLLYTENGGKTWNNDNMSGMPGPHYLFSVYATSPNRVYVGDLGYIYHKYYGYWYSTQLPVTDQVRDITFVDSYRGWAVGNNGMVLTTYDGGWSWQQVYYGNGPMGSSQLYGINFVNADTGFIASFTDRNIYRTTNGGASWQSINPSVSTYWRDISIAGRSVYIGGSYGYVYYSHDAGNTWDFSITNQSTISKMSAIDSKHAFASAQYGVNYTKDGGKSWNYIPVNGVNDKMTAMHYTDTLNGWFAGYYDIFRTANTGCLSPRANMGPASQEACGSLLLRADTAVNSRNDSYKWSNGSTSPNLLATTSGQYRVTVSNICGYSHADTVNVTIKTLPTVYAGKDSSIVIGSTYQLQGASSNGTSFIWRPNQYFTSDTTTLTPSFKPLAKGTFKKALIATASNGCTASDSVVIISDTYKNLAEGWIRQTSGLSNNFSDIYFVNDTLGWACYNDKMYYSSTGGAIWDAKTIPNISYPSRVNFKDKNFGWVLNSNYQMIRTINGGNNWTTYNLPPSNNYVDMSFIDKKFGWVVGYNGKIASTSDSGKTWVDQISGTDAQLNSVFFVNQSIGYACGNSGYLLKTTNGGSNWTATDDKISSSAYFYDIWFTHIDTGYVLTSNNIYKTTNGGTTWLQLTTPYSYSYSKIWFVNSKVGFISCAGGVLRTNDAGTNWTYLPVASDIYFNTVMFVDEQNGWVASSNGRIYRTGSGGCRYRPFVDLVANQNLCPSDAITLDASTSYKNENSTYQWYLNDQPSVVSTNGTYNATTGVEHKVKVTNLCNLSASDSTLITMYPIVNANAGKDTTFCQNKNYTFGATGGTSYQWLTTDYLSETNIANPTLSNIVAGSYLYVVRVKDANLCQKTDTVKLTVRAQPSSKFTIGSTEICNGDSLMVTLQSYDSSIAGNYQWNFNGGGTSPANVTSEGLQYKVKWSGNDTTKSIVLSTFKTYNDPSITCYSDTTTSKVKIKPLPGAGFTLSSTPYCTSDTIQAIYKGSSTGKTFSWILSAGTEYEKGNTNDTFVFVSKMPLSNIPIKLTVSQNACSKDSTATLNVFEKPFVKLESASQVCSGQGVELKSQLNVGSGYIYYWNLDGGKRLKGDSIKGYTVQWDTAGIKTIGLQVVNQGCTNNTSYRVVQVKPTPKAGFNIPEKVCQRDTLFITYGGIASNLATVNWEAQDAGIYSTSGFDRKAFFGTHGIKTIKQFIVDAGCNSDTLSKTIEVIENPNNQLTIPANNVCAGTNFVIGAVGKNFGAQSTYKWQLNGATIVSGDTINGYTVKWDTVGMKNIKLEINNKGCKDTIKVKTVEVKYVPTSNFTFKSPQCFDDSVLVTFTGNALPTATATWNFDGGVASSSGGFNRKVKYSTGGSKNLSLSLSDNGCSSETINKPLIVSYPAETPICMVTVDLETGNNLVVWERKQNKGIQSYNVYRQGNVASKYDLLKSVPFSELSTYVDITSKHENQAEYYKLTTVDTCGNEYPITNAKSHKTIFLQYVSSIGGVNLNWDYYEVNGSRDSAKFDSYVLYKGLDSSKLQIVATVASNINRYTDTEADAQIKRYYYRVGGLRNNACAPATLSAKANSGPFSHSVSNLEDNRLRFDGGVSIAERGLRTFAFTTNPNPAKDFVNLNCYTTIPGYLDVYLLDATGTKIKLINNRFVEGGNQNFKFTVNDFGLSKGFYMILVNFNGFTKINKLIIE